MEYDFEVSTKIGRFCLPQNKFCEIPINPIFLPEPCRFPHHVPLGMLCRAFIVSLLVSHLVWKMQKVTEFTFALFHTLEFYGTICQFALKIMEVEHDRKDHDVIHLGQVRIVFLLNQKV